MTRAAYLEHLQTFRDRCACVEIADVGAAQAALLALQDHLGSLAESYDPVDDTLEQYTASALQIFENYRPYADHAEEAAPVLEAIRATLQAHRTFLRDAGIDVDDR